MRVIADRPLGFYMYVNILYQAEEYMSRTPSADEEDEPTLLSAYRRRIYRIAGTDIRTIRDWDLHTIYIYSRIMYLYCKTVRGFCSHLPCVFITCSSAITISAKAG